MAKTIVYAPGIHTGGGRTLLLDLLASLNEQDLALVDPKLSLERISPKSAVQRLKNTPLQELFDQRQLEEACKEGTHLICFSNLPPRKRLKIRTTVFLQNRFLLENPWKFLPPKRALELTLLQILLKSRSENTDDWVVQGETMRSRLQEKVVKREREIHILRLTPKDLLDQGPKPITFKKECEYDFIYPADLLPHKNHENLLKAWELLKSQGLEPNLLLLIPANSPKQVNELRRWTNQIGLHVLIREGSSYEEVQKDYDRSLACIFPSLLESFGLPIVEAHLKGLPILASDTDYVWDLIEPTVRFDPDQPRLIARAVERFLRLKDQEDTILLPKQALVGPLEPTETLLKLAHPIHRATLF